VAFVQIPEIYVPAWMVVLIIGREFLITGLRTLAASKGRILPASRAGKFKTTSQMVCIITILVILTVNSLFESYLGGLPPESYQDTSWWYYFAWILRGAPYWLTFVTSILTFFSGYLYLRDNTDLFEQNEPKQS
jgi:CDP-diacylglycerol--glycerol-3-phosphate 3-phosphatidyltransferase